MYTLLKYFKALCKKLYLGYGKNQKCGSYRCNNMIVRQSIEKKSTYNFSKCKHTCKGCKVMKYCSRICQKLDWKKRHRNQCIGVALKNLSQEQNLTMKRMQLMLDMCLKYI